MCSPPTRFECKLSGMRRLLPARVPAHSGGELPARHNCLGAYCVPQYLRVLIGHSNMLSGQGWTGNECMGSGLNNDPSMRAQHSPRRFRSLTHASLGKSCSTTSLWHAELRFSDRGPAGWAIAVKATALPACQPASLPASQARWRVSPDAVFGPAAWG